MTTKLFRERSTTVVASVKLLILASIEPPRRTFWPVAERFRGPRGGLVGVARRARVRDFVFVRESRSDERKGVSANFHVGNGGLDFRHVAGDTLAAGRSVFVMRVLFKRCRSRTVQGQGGVAIQAKLVG
jgi:hypothetical protein